MAWWKSAQRPGAESLPIARAAAVARPGWGIVGTSAQAAVRARGRWEGCAGRIPVGTVSEGQRVVAPKRGGVTAGRDPWHRPWRRFRVVRGHKRHRAGCHRFTARRKHFRRLRSHSGAGDRFQALVQRGGGPHPVHQRSVDRLRRRTQCRRPHPHQLPRRIHGLTRRHYQRPMAPGEKNRPATLLGANAAADLAVIHVDQTSGFTPAPLGNSDHVQVGNAVMAMGSPKVCRGP